MVCSKFRVFGRDRLSRQHLQPMGTKVFPGDRPRELAFFAGEFEEPLPELAQLEFDPGPVPKERPHQRLALLLQLFGHFGKADHV